MNQRELHIWESCLGFIRDNITPEQFDTIFAFVKFVDFKDNKLVLSVPSVYVKDHIEQNYLHLVRTAIRRYFGESVELYYKITVSSSPKAEVSQKAEEKQQEQAPDFDSQLRSAYSFDTYLEGESNRLARSIGEAIAKNPAKTFNPFFVYGPSGCGKTHLVNAIGLQIKEQHPQLRVLYVSAHLFMVQWTEAVRKNLRNDFIAFYQTIDVLIIDDVQELSGKKDTQNTFFHIFNHLHLNRKQIILSADRPPVEIKDLEDRLLTRFKWGLQAEIEKPTKSLRYSILSAKVRKEGLRISENVLSYISENIDESVRDLEGIINSLMAYSVVYNCDINMQLVNKVMPRFKTSIPEATKSYSVEQICELVSQHFGVDVNEIYSRSRRQPISFIRQVAIYMADKYTGESNVQVGLKIGGRNHATVIHSINSIKNLLEYDEETRETIRQIEEAI